MEIVLSVFILIVAFIVLVFGGNKFVDSSIALSKKLKIPPAVVGATITSIGTTLPELLVTIFSSSSDASGLAVGNSLGSIIFNSCIIGGILLLCMAVSLKESGKLCAVLLLFILGITCVMCINGSLGIWEAMVLLVLFVAFIIINYINAKRAPLQSQVPAQGLNKPTYIYVFMFILSAGAIALGAYFLVHEAKFLAGMAGLSDTFIGLTIVGMGTSLPELITTISSIRKKEPGLGLGNIIGSNIINCSLLLAITTLVSGGTLAVSKDTIFITIPTALFVCLLLLVPTIIKGKSKKWQGITLLGLYFAYFIYLALSALGIISI